jgi:hypothetical protein
MRKKYSGAEQATDDMVHARWLPKATNTLLEYVILIGFPLFRAKKSSARLPSEGK